MFSLGGGAQDFVKTRASAQAEYVYESKQLSDAVSDRNKSSSAKKQATLDFEIARVGFFARWVLLSIIVGDFHSIIMGSLSTAGKSGGLS